MNTAIAQPLKLVSNTFSNECSKPSETTPSNKQLFIEIKQLLKNNDSIKEESQQLKRYAKRMQADRDVFRNEALRLVQKCEALEASLAELTEIKAARANAYAKHQQRKQSLNHGLSKLKQKLTNWLKDIGEVAISFRLQTKSKINEARALQAEKRAQARAQKSQIKLKQARNKRRELMAKHRANTIMLTKKEASFVDWEVARTR